MVKSFEDVQKTGKDNFDTTMKAFGAFSKGVQAMAFESADYAKKAFEEGTTAAERLLAAKSLDKAIEVQSEYIRGAYEGFISQSTKLAQIYADLALEAWKPFESRWAKTTSAG